MVDTHPRRSPRRSSTTRLACSRSPERNCRGRTSGPRGDEQEAPATQAQTLGAAPCVERRDQLATKGRPQLVGNGLKQVAERARVEEVDERLSARVGPVALHDQQLDE